MMEMNQMLRIIVEHDASDLHISVGKQPVMRLGHSFEVVDPDVLTPDDTERLMREICPPRYQQMLQEKGSTDFAYALGDMARFRCAVLRTRGNIGIVMRLIPSRILPFEKLGLPFESIVDDLTAPRGLVIVTGPTGSGKTTTLATMIDWINRNRQAHIITIEDPIEYIQPHQKSIVTHRELYVDTPSFAYALRGALRQDPDVILVGEMRDLETMEAALTAAETGHLVFGTLHTIGAAETINRIINQFPTNQQEQIRASLAEALRSVISQALLPRASGKGRVAAYEIMHKTPAVANLIREAKTNRITSVIQTSAKMGMITLDDYLFNLYRKNVITGELCLERSQDRGEMQKRMLGTAGQQEEQEGGGDGKPSTGPREY